jgi:signal transduction histidine kinase
MRFMLFELQSPSLVEAGLAQALNSRLDMVERRIGTKVNCSIDDTLFLDEQTRTELYYVAIEAMNNAFSHGNGDRLDLSIFQDGHYGYLIVADNGRGFDIDNVSYGMGLNSMQQRVEGLGGRLTIASEINGGTKIMAEVPLPEQVPQARVI